MLTYVDLETAKSAQRPCLVLLRGAPSPWSQAAKAIFELKGIDALGLWMDAGDPAVSAWTGMMNAPVVIVPAEPSRTNWADILAFAERVSSQPRLVPAELAARMHMLGLCHELMGEGGLMWNGRLVMLALSHATEGKRGFPMTAAQYLGARYGYVPGCGDGARAAAQAQLAALGAQLERGLASDGPYYFGGVLTALDIYSAAVVDMFAPLPHEQCPMRPKLRVAFESLHEELAAVLPASLVTHRDLMHARHMPLPIAL